MLTLEELDKAVREYAEAEHSKDPSFLETWEQAKRSLGPHEEEVPCGPPELGLYELVDVNGTAIVNEDELYDLCWKLGCSVGYTQDYWTGEPTMYVWLPTTEEEYKRNLEEGAKNWAENS